MANEQIAATKPAKPNFFVKIGRWFKNVGLKIGRAFKNMWHELKKVTWPSRKELINSSLVVIAFMAAMAIVIGLIDALSGWLMKLIMG